MNNIKEIWKPIKGYVNYEVSNLGNVRSKDRIVLMKNGRKRFRESKTLAKAINNKGYLVVSIYNLRAERSVVRVHRVVAEGFVSGKTKIRNQVNHKDGNKLNNHVDNLEWCSQYENNHHAYKNKLIVQLKGENHPLAKLSISEVRDIRRLLKTTKLYHREIAEIYNVSVYVIGAISRGETYNE